MDVRRITVLTLPMGEAQQISAAEMLKHLFDDVVWLHVRWRTYLSLFGKEEARVDALNNRTGHAFGVMQRVVVDSVILDAAKLLSREKSAGHAVVSLGGAIHALPASVPETTKTELSMRFRELRTKHETIITHRDQRIAHNDWNIATKAEPLPGVSRQHIQMAIDDAFSLLNAIGMVLNGGQFSVPDWDDEERSTRVLLRVLELGNAEIDRRNEAKRAKFKELFGVDSKRDDPLDQWDPERYRRDG